MPYFFIPICIILKHFNSPLLHINNMPKFQMVLRYSYKSLDFFFKFFFFLSLFIYFDRGGGEQQREGERERIPRGSTLSVQSPIQGSIS